MIEHLVDVVKNKIHDTAQDPLQLCNSNLSLQFVFALCFAITSCAVFHEDNPGAGFFLFLVNITELFFVVSSQRVLNQNVPKHLMPNHRRYEMLYFAMLGCDFICSLISLMTAVYWGQSANCESPPYKIRYFQCGNKRCDYIHTFIHSFIHTYIHTNIYVCVHVPITLTTVLLCHRQCISCIMLLCCISVSPTICVVGVIGVSPGAFAC